MGNVTDIFTREERASRADANEGVDHKAVEILEKFLDGVKSGRITGFAIVAGTEDDSTITSWTKAIFDDPYMYLGRLDAVRHELLIGLHEEIYGPVAHDIVEENEDGE